MTGCVGQAIINDAAATLKAPLCLSPPSHSGRSDLGASRVVYPLPYSSHVRLLVSAQKLRHARPRGSVLFLVATHARTIPQGRSHGTSRHSANHRDCRELTAHRGLCCRVRWTQDTARDRMRLPMSDVPGPGGPQRAAALPNPMDG